MAPQPADNLFPPGDPPLHVNDQVRAGRAYASKLFAEVAVRIVAFAADVIAVLFLVNVFSDHVHYLDENLRPAVSVLLLLAWFTACWAGPLRATPFQFAFRMRVLHKTGRNLSLGEAAVRSMLLVASGGLALYVLLQSYLPGVGLTIAAVVLMLYVPSVTACRQGLHDLLSHSVVINLRALHTADDENQMHEFLAEGNQAARKAARPSIVKMAGDAVVLAIPLFIMATVIQVSHQKNLYGRIAYAMSEAQETKHLAKTWFETTGEWPQNEAELGRPLRHDYPGGGYFELQENGVIRIQFEIVPELRNGSILIEPRVDDGEVTWRCRAVGDIDRSALPGGCRDSA